MKNAVPGERPRKGGLRKLFGETYVISAAFASRAERFVCR